MRIGELAALAGVTVRTLRHPHQIGILPEPERGENRYRTYALRDLTRVLRIRSLSAAGVPLAEATALLDGRLTEDELDDLLATIDDELGRRIAELEAQRALVARARAAHAAPDLPASLDRVLATVARTRTVLDGALHAQSVLLGPLMRGDDGPRIEAVFSELQRAGLLPAALRASERFEALTPASDPDEVARVVGDLTAVADHVARTFDPADRPALRGADARALLHVLRRDGLNETQRAVLARFDD